MKPALTEKSKTIFGLRLFQFNPFVSVSELLMLAWRAGLSRNMSHNNGDTETNGCHGNKLKKPWGNCEQP
jgi:hypothetical protein